MGCQKKDEKKKSETTTVLQQLLTGEIIQETEQEWERERAEVVF